MKKIKYLLLVTMSIIAFISCDDDSEFGSGIQDSDPTIISLNQTSESVFLSIGESIELDFSINASKTSNVDRVITLELNEATSLPSESFTVSPMQVTIPANEFVANFSVTITENQGMPSEDNLILDIPESAEYQISTLFPSLNINVNVVCPVEDTEFIGNYQLTNITPVDFGNLYAEGQIVNISAGDVLGERMFEAVVLEDLDIGQPATILTFNLVCDSVVLPPNQPTNLQCGGSLDLGPAIGDVLGSYTTGDDSEFEIVIGYNEPGTATCAMASDAVIRLTKI
ncbi:hypothetical protein [uncultured Dokdonia sp.]|uniref:hypothetical protein n=1 Tax=uncultured Dokdonia sp. TaxID=575653 RepID=UPI00262BA1C6|nr:hypothetical protein [uncultured Dokdonia sp.]